MKKRSTKYFIPIILFCLTACNFQGSDNEEPGPAPFPQPKTFPINTDGGYITNTLTGDTIQPLINSLGDTIKTGVAIPTQGKFINPDSVSKPKIVKVGTNPKTVNAHPNVHIIPDNLTIIPVDESKLKKIPFIPQTSPFPSTNSPFPPGRAGDGTGGGYILNSTGDTIPTGIPILTKGKTVPCSYPKSTPALPLRMKDNAICDIQYLDVDQGMSSSYIRAMLEDKSGNLWFGTYGGGISKYDGKSFTHFTENEGLSNNYVMSILEDKSGNLWSGTSGGGVSKYDGKSFTHFTENEGLSNNYVLSILEDKSGNLWFGTNGGGVSKYDGKSFVHFTENEGLSNNSVSSILEDKSGNLWFGTPGGGVSKYDGKSFVHFTQNEGLSNNYVFSIIEDKSGNLWFGSRGGVSKYDGKSFTHFTENEGLTNNAVMSILEDKSGNLWFGTSGGGVIKYDGKSFTHFTENEGLSNNTAVSILEDKSGNLWFGTSGGGVSKYDGKSFTHFTENEGLTNNRVSSILEDKSGNLWFGTTKGGVSKYDGKSFTHFTENEGLSNEVWSILEDKSGNLWFGTYGGGVSKYDGKSFTHFTENEGLSNSVVRSILEDKSGNLWFGTSGGVSKYDGKSFTHFTENEGLSNNVIRSIVEDNLGNLWFGSTGGVSKYDGKSFTHFTENEGLSNNVVHSILEDKSGPQQSIWVNTDKGLSLIKMNCAQLSEKQAQESTYAEASMDENQKYSIITFNKSDGLKGLYFSAFNARLDSKNRIWWGGSKGLEMLDLNEFKTSDKIPIAFLKSLDINETFIDYRNLVDSAKNEIEFNDIELFENYPLNLELSYNKNHLTFHFAAIDWAAPHKIKYQYKLEGLDENWSPVTDKTEADYRNIPYGIFTFKVRAIGESQIWGEAFEYTFTIHPPWWHTWWFRGLMAFAFVLILFLLYRSRTAALRARQKQLEKTVEERTEDLKKEKELVEEKQKETEKQKEIIEEKHKEITDSINYAERIQRSFLATQELLDENLRDYFVFFKPKDVVSGDFYWASQLNNSNFAFCCADSTGHGVPGAIMSILNISSLEKSIEAETEAHIILNKTRQIIIERLKKDGSKQGGKDGMDCSLLVLDKNKTALTFASANNPVIIIRAGEILEFKGDKIPVGKHDRDQESFSLQTVPLQRGDVIYTLTDGFPDQFGGEKGKKYMIKNLKQFFLNVASLNMPEQKEKLNEEFNNWIGEHEQVDDVCVIGVRV